MSTTPKKKGPSHATQLIKLALNSGELFHAPNGDPYITVQGPTRSYALNTKAFREYLAREFYKTRQMGVSASSLKDAIAALSGSASLNGPEIAVYNRVAGLDHEVYLDLGDAQHTIIRVDAQGWGVVPLPDHVRLVRKPGMLALPMPVAPNERLDVLLPQVLNLSSVRDVQLTVAWLVVALRGKKPYFILAVRGASGAAKTMGSTLIRNVIDPNEVKASRPPKDTRDLMIAAGNSFVTSFDNLSYIKEDLSDDLCSLSTGAGFRTRQLTTDNDETIFSAASPIIFNGIPDVLSRPDLAQRCLVVVLEGISDEKRKSEREVLREYAALHPQLLGGVLYAVSAVLAHEDTTRPAKLPRMADAAITITAAEDALGWAPGTFIDLLNDNDQNNASSLLDGNYIAKVVQGLLKPWVGEANDLARIVGGDWTPKKLVNELRRLEGALASVGIRVVLPKAQERAGALRGKRLIEITDMHVAQQLTFADKLKAWEDMRAAQQATTWSAAPATPPPF